MASNPVWLLVFLAPFVGWAVWMVRYVVRPRTRWTAASLVGALVLAAIVLAVNLAGRFIGAFGGALLAAWIAVVIAWAIAILRFRTSAKPAKLEPVDRRTRSAVLLVLAPLATAVALLAVSACFHDEIIVTGHLSIANAMARGVFPPVYLAFPDVLYKYHYGFDLLAAVLVRLGGTPAEHATDCLSVFLFILLFVLAWSTAHELTRSRLAGWTAALLVTLGGGFAAGLAWLPGFQGALAAAASQEGLAFRGAAVNPNMLSYFFQHPFALGIPLFVAGVYLYVRFVREGRYARLALLCGVLGALALAQICLFVILCCGLAVAPAALALVRAAKLRRLALPTVVCLAIGLLLAWLGGGFFVSTDAIEQGVHLRARLGALPGGLGADLLWMLAANGWVLVLLVPCLVVAILRKRDLGLFASIMALGALVVPLLFTYDRTWDIIKFLTVSYVAGALALADLAGAIVPRLGSRARKVAVAIVLATACAPGVAYLAINLDRATHAGDGRFQHRQLALPPTDIEAFDWLREHAGPRDVLVTAPDKASLAASYTGLPNPRPDNAYALGFPLARCRQREDDLFVAVNEPCLDRLRQMGARWLYLSEDRVRRGNILTHRSDFQHMVATGAIKVRGFGPPGEGGVLFEIDLDDDTPCLCNLHLDDLLRRDGAHATGDDLLNPKGAPLADVWKRPDGGPLPAWCFAEKDGRADGVTVGRSARAESDNVAAVARTPETTLLRCDFLEVHFEGKAAFPHFGEMTVQLVDESGGKTRLRWYRWTARTWKTFSVFVRKPQGTSGDIEVILAMSDKGMPGEVTYRHVSLRRALAPVRPD